MWRAARDLRSAGKVNSTILCGCGASPTAELSEGPGFVFLKDNEFSKGAACHIGVVAHSIFIQLVY